MVLSNRFLAILVGTFIFTLSLVAEVSQFGNFSEWYSFFVDYRDRGLALLDAVTFSIWWPSAWFALLGSLASLLNFRNSLFLNSLSWVLISMTVIFPLVVASLASLS